MEQTALLPFGKRFEQACSIRFLDEDIEWKDTFKKDRDTGKLEKVGELAYLNWAVAWRHFLTIYPEGELTVLEHDGNPLWDINGFGMVKVSLTACGITRTELFPIMRGGQNDAMPTDTIDARDINDAIQRATVKLIARFGVGLYIYEGKLPPKKVTYPDKKEAPAQTGYAPQPQKNLTAASEKQKDLVKRLLEEKGRTIEQYGLDSLETLTTAQASNLITNLMQLPKVEKTPEPKKEFDDDLPF